MELDELESFGICATCGRLICGGSGMFYGEIELPAEGAEETVVEEDAELEIGEHTMEGRRVVEYSEYETVEYWECGCWFREDGASITDIESERQ